MRLSSQFLVIGSFVLIIWRKKGSLEKKLDLKLLKMKTAYWKTWLLGDWLSNDLKYFLSACFLGLWSKLECYTITFLCEKFRLFAPLPLPSVGSLQEPPIVTRCIVWTLLSNFEITNVRALHQSQMIS